MNQPKWKIIIVGESQEDCQALDLLLKSTASVEVIKAVCGLQEAIPTLQQWHSSCNLMFLQVNLSDGNIFDVLDQVEGIQAPMVFLSDDDKMRPRAAKYNAFHYNTKPFSIDTFLPIFQELDKASHQYSIKKTLSSVTALVEDILHVKANGTKHMIPTNEIVYVFGEGNYATFCLNTGAKLLISKPLIQLERLLPAYQFHRIHQSYLVNRHKIANIKYGATPYLILENGEQCPISRRRKHGFVQWLSSNATSHTLPLPLQLDPHP